MITTGLDCDSFLHSVYPTMLIDLKVETNTLLLV